MNPEDQFFKNVPEKDKILKQVILIRDNCFKSFEEVLDKGPDFKRTKSFLNKLNKTYTVLSSIETQALNWGWMIEDEQFAQDFALCKGEIMGMLAGTEELTGVIIKGEKFWNEYLNGSVSFTGVKEPDEVDVDELEYFNSFMDEYFPEEEEEKKEEELNKEDDSFKSKKSKEAFKDFTKKHVSKDEFYEEPKNVQFKEPTKFVSKYADLSDEEAIKLYKAKKVKPAIKSPSKPKTKPTPPPKPAHLKRPPIKSPSSPLIDLNASPSPTKSSSSPLIDLNASPSPVKIQKLVKKANEVKQELMGNSPQKAGDVIIKGVKYGKKTLEIVKTVNGSYYYINDAGKKVYVTKKPRIMEAINKHLKK